MGAGSLKLTVLFVLNKHMVSMSLVRSKYSELLSFLSKSTFRIGRGAENIWVDCGEFKKSIHLAMGTRVDVRDAAL